MDDIQHHIVHDPPPAPAELVVESLRSAESNGSAADTPQAAEESSVDNSRSASPDSAGQPRATTTVTTVYGANPATGDEGEVKTQTFTHLNSSAVDTEVVQKDGTVLLRPIPARGAGHTRTRRSKAAFSPKISHFDRNNTDSAQDPFRGFYTLFWLMVFVGMAKTGVRSWNEGGVVFGLSFARLIGRDGIALGLSDGVMVASTLLCVPFAQLLRKGWLRYRGAGQIIQHIAQTAFLAASVRWTVHRDWPWVQSGFMVLHTLTMLMKVHSYCAYNGDLSEKLLLFNKLQPALQERLAEHGGKAEAEKEARLAWDSALSEHEGDIEKVLDSALVRPKDLAAALGRDKSGLRQRTRRAPTVSGSSMVHAQAHTHRGSTAPTEGLQTLTWHPDEAISSLAIKLVELNEALVSTGVAKTRWPDNISYYNFIDYLLVPTLVYHLEYPRTKVIRPVYVLEKVVALFGTLSILILICEHYIIPVYPKEGDPFVQSVLDLALPFMLNYLLIFYLIFECVCNIFAELTYFADRGFFSDWWNSTTFDEFSRRWNVPVHTFLLRHVYSSTISAYGFSKFQAAFTTFLLSACVHELVMAVSMKKFRLYLFLMQMAQLPLIMIGRLPILRKYPALGNLFFWLGLLSGFPLLAVCYIRY